MSSPVAKSALWRVTEASVLLSCLLAVFSAPLVAQDAEIRSALDGVYTNEQADEGEKTFSNICSSCHTDEDDPLSGRSFIGTWADRPLYALWEYTTTRMPYRAPGSLSPEEYAAVLAHILRMNGYPASDVPLPHSPFEVADIDLDLHPHGLVDDLRPTTEPYDASTEISPRGGPPGTAVIVRASNLPPSTPVHIAFGGVGLGFEGLAFVLTTPEGLVEERVEVPRWANPERIHRFLIFDVYFQRILVWDAFDVTDSGGRIRREGEVTEVGVTCSVVSGTDQDTYFLLGDTGHLNVGDRVVLEGVLLDSSECGEGVHLEVVSVSRRSSLPGPPSGPS